MNGFTYGGVSNIELGVIMNSKSIPLFPKIRENIDDNALRDGVYDFGVYYKERRIDVDCTLIGSNDDELEENLNKLASLLNPRRGSQPLIFHDRPYLVYFGRVANDIPIRVKGRVSKFTITFVCNDPFAYSFLSKEETITTPRVIKSGGTYWALPKLKITTTGGAGSIGVYKDEAASCKLTFKKDSTAGVYEIDCKECTILKDNKPVYHFVDGDFLRLGSGDNRIVLSGSVTKAVLTYRDTYL